MKIGKIDILGLFDVINIAICVLIVGKLFL